MSKFKKPRYKIYNHLLEDVRHDFQLEKFNSLKWNKLKKKLRYETYRWDLTKFKGLKWDLFQKKYTLINQFCYLKKLKFFFEHSGSFVGNKKIFKPQKNNSSIFSFWEHKRLKKSFKYNLLNKQKLIYFYNIQNYKLKKLVKSYSSSFFKKYNFMEKLEKRLDVVLYRSGLVKTLYQSRQLINHRKVLVNNNIQSQIDYLLQKGDFVELLLSKSYIKTNLVILHENQKKKYQVSKNLIFKKSSLFRIFKEFNLSYQFSKSYRINFSNSLTQFIFLYSFPNHLEVNYKTFSLIFLDTIDLKKSFKYYLDLSSVISYYLIK